MKVKVSEQSIKHLVDNDCVDMVVAYIRKLEAENARLRKAGAVMGQHLPDTDEANAAYADFEKGGQS